VNWTIPLVAIAAAPVGPVTLSKLPEVKAVAPPPLIFIPVPVVKAAAEISKTSAVVKELAVQLTKSPAVWTPVEVIPKIVPEVAEVSISRVASGVVSPMPRLSAI